MVDEFFNFIKLCWAWIPGKFIVMVGLLVAIYCSDAILGILDRGWRIIGR